jgi:hypothetical protein
MKIDGDGRITQFVGRAASDADVAPVHALLTAWDCGPSTLESYLNSTYPFDPVFASTHHHTVHAVGPERDAMTTVWSATTASSVSPQGLVVGQYTLRDLAGTTNWTIHALETEVMPVPGAQAFKSGYITEQSTVQHRWAGAFAKYDNIYSVPHQSTAGSESIYGSLVLAKDADYHYRYSQSPSTLNYRGGFLPGGSSAASTNTTVSWSVGYSSTDPAGYRGTFNPISVVAVKHIAASHPLALADIDTTTTFKRAGHAEPAGPHASLRLTVIGGSVP